MFLPVPPRREPIDSPEAQPPSLAEPAAPEQWEPERRLNLIETLNRYPVTATTGVLAVAATLAWWSQRDVNFLFMTVDAWHGEPWRLITSAFLHLDLLHLLFNLYWLWRFGVIVESRLGSWATLGMMVLLEAGSGVAQYAFSDAGVGLSGIGYGLFGLLWVLDRRDVRFRGSMHQNTIVLFLGWFVFCWFTTAVGAWQVGNVAHGVGAILGSLLGLAITAQSKQRLFHGSVIAATVALIFLGATMGRPYLAKPDSRARELAYLGYLDLEQEKNERAVERFNQAVALNPNEADWWQNLGIALHRLDRTKASIEAYQHALNLRPTDKEVRRYVAGAKGYLAYQESLAGRSDEAIQLYLESLALDDRQASAWYNLGNSYWRVGRPADARNAYQRALALDPTNKAYQAALSSVPLEGSERK